MFYFLMISVKNSVIRDMGRWAEFLRFGGKVELFLFSKGSG